MEFSMGIYCAAAFIMNTRRPGGGSGTCRREKCQWFGVRLDGELGLPGRALKAAIVSTGFNLSLADAEPAFLSLCIYCYRVILLNLEVSFEEGDLV